MKKYLVLLLVLLAVMLCLCGCTVQDGDIAAVAIEQGVMLVTRFLESVILLVGAWTLDKIGKEKALKNTAVAMDLLFTLTRQTVGELQQTLVENWKEAGGGKLTDEQIRKLREELLRVVKLKLDDASKELIIAAGSDIDALIAGEAEKLISGISDATVYIG